MKSVLFTLLTGIAAAPALSQTSSLGSSDGRLAYALVTALAIAAAVLVWLVRRPGPRPAWLSGLAIAPQDKGAQIKSVTLLRGHGSLQVVQWGDQQFLLACAPQAITLLGTRPAGSTAPSTDALSATAAGTHQEPT